MLNAIRRFVDSMAGRIFGVLILGIATAALVASVLADWQRSAEVSSERADRVVDRFAAALAADPPPPGTHRLNQLPVGTPAPTIVRRLAVRMPDLRGVAVNRVAPASCAPLPPPPPSPPPPQPPATGPHPPLPPPPLACYAVRFQQGGGIPLVLAIDAPPSPGLSEPVASPAFLLILALAAVALALVVARMAARPIERLGQAAQTLAADLHAAPVAERGPGEVRHAMRAFNTMQVRLVQTLEERTYMLAAISHDLRSPLTRMRLRLEGMTDTALRDRLIADAQTMTALIEEGLELARLSRDTDADRVAVDIGALVTSLCEDAQDIGQHVSFQPPARTIAMTQPEALRRIITNLIDNAMHYGGSAQVEVVSREGGVWIHVLDRGPGIPEAELERMFEPFRRLDAARSNGKGSGLGLTIARMLARRIGCSVALQNRSEGGLRAIVGIP